ncbi:5-methyltetrahydropteroyltriglutamate--homocysteine S-methyltransferase, partial [Klebsiella pneumoniae]|nr:5-methyltetrahydropteroyltriglutamate--homocysteine S-methyltransferase [Klebsiella pneumoniae]
GKAAPAYNIRVVDKISFPAQHPCLEDFSFLKEVVEVGDGTVAKATIPSPTMILRQEILSNDGTSRIQTIYPEIGDFYKDLAQTYKDAIAA